MKILRNPEEIEWELHVVGRQLDLDQRFLNLRLPSPVLEGQIICLPYWSRDPVDTHWGFFLFICLFVWLFGCLVGFLWKCAVSRSLFSPSLKNSLSFSGIEDVCKFIDSFIKNLGSQSLSVEVCYFQVLLSSRLKNMVTSELLELGVEQLKNKC